jgi:hypothetical protein
VLKPATGGIEVILQQRAAMQWLMNVYYDALNGIVKV